jgi:hypothetical protein
LGSKCIKQPIDLAYALTTSVTFSVVAASPAMAVLLITRQNKNVGIILSIVPAKNAPFYAYWVSELLIFSRRK